MSRGDIPEVSRRLADALVEAYSQHVRRRVSPQPVPGLEEAIEEGRSWLASALADLLARPFPDQRRGPLELFQEAMRFPTARLLEAGAEPVSRDPVAESALPGDVYDLAPASSRDLGEEVWAVHLAWGAAKAAAITAPPSPGPADDES